MDRTSPRKEVPMQGIPLFQGAAALVAAWAAVSVAAAVACSPPAKQQGVQPAVEAAPIPRAASESVAPTIHAEVVTGARRDSATTFSSTRLAFDKGGVLHLTYTAHGDEGSKVFHQQRTAGGAWSAPEVLLDGNNAASLLMKPNGEVCVFWNGYTDERPQGVAQRMRCQVGDAWSPAQNVGNFYNTEPTFARDGTPQAIRAGTEGAFYQETRLSTSGCWPMGGFLAIDRAGQFHAVWRSVSNDGCKTGGTEYSFSADGGKTWSKPDLLDDTEPVALFADALGRVHLLLADGTYKQWTTSKGWGETISFAPPVTIPTEPNVFAAPMATLSANGAVHLVAQDFYSLEHYYTHQNNDGSWSAPVTILRNDAVANLRIVVIAVDAGGRPQFAWVGSDNNLYVATLQ